MIDDFVPQRKKPKVIEPLPKEEKTPLPVLSDDTEPVDTPFKTPEELATSEPTPEKTTGATVSVHQKYRWPFNRKQTIIGAAIAVLIIGGGITSFALTRPNVKGGVYHSKKGVYVPPKPTTVASALTGLQVDPSVNQRPVTGVMIENSFDSRPQSGLDQAGVVFEAIAEGGITRFLTLFQDTQPDYLGPVRSVRPYYVQWCMGFDCSIAHVGGSPEALQDIRSWGVKDLDQFANGGSYLRISSRYAPHNVYTSLTQLNQLESSKGFGASSYTGLLRKADEAYKAPQPTTSKTTAKTKPDTRTPANTIDLAVSSALFNSHYDYEAATNSYKRSEGGAPHLAQHKDGTQVQITPKVVIAMVMQYGLEADDHHSQYNVIGSGQAFIFQDGTVTVGTWAKSDAKSQITFTDASGQAIKLNAGQTWLTAMSAANQVTYK
ncbi:MAG: DUF3048 domain-containing protein [Candidatus Saccharimonadales bacterium]